MERTPEQSSSNALRIQYFIPEKVDCASITIPNCNEQEIATFKTLLRKEGNIEQDTTVITIGGIPLQRRYICSFTLSFNNSVFVPVNEWI